MNVTRTCPVTGTINTRFIEGLTESLMEAWKAGGVLIQDAMPALSTEEREFILTGITSYTWKLSFGWGLPWVLDRGALKGYNILTTRERTWQRKTKHPSAATQWCWL